MRTQGLGDAMDALADRAVSEGHVLIAAGIQALADHVRAAEAAEAEARSCPRPPSPRLVALAGGRAGVVR